MRKYMVRIELHNSPDSDYNILHKQMDYEDFSKTIVGDDNITYPLPNGEYFKEGEYTIDEVFRSAKRAINVTSIERGEDTPPPIDASILVTGPGGVVFENLK